MTHSMLSLAPRSALRDAVKSERELVAALSVASGGGQPEEVAAIAAPLEVSGLVSPHPVVPPLDEKHPAALVFHCLNNCAQIIGGDFIEQADIDRARELLGEGTEHAAALYLEFIRAERYSLRVETKNSELTQAVIDLTKQLDEAHAIVREIRDSLHGAH